MTGYRHVTTTGTWRVARGAVVGVSAGALAVSAHVAGGDSTPALLLWLVPMGLVVGAGVVASRWRWTVPGLLAVFSVVQLGFHAVFELYGGHGGHSGPGAHAEPVGPLAHVAGELTALGPRMLVMHVVAALVLTLMMRLGEDGLRSALDVLLLRVVALFDVSRLGVPDSEHRVGLPARAVLVAYDPAHARWSRGPPR